MISLTHKEAAFLVRGTLGWASPLGLVQRLRFRHLRGLALASFARRVLSKLQEKYRVGVHVGSSLPADHPAFDSDRWDFILCTEKLWRGPPSLKMIPLSSAHFIPERFSSKVPQKKEWDLTYIATDSWYKNWPIFAKVSRELVEQDSKFKILAVSTHTNEPGRKNFVKWLKRKLGDTYGKNVTHFTAVTNGADKGFDQEKISSILRSTKFFVLFSQSEGSSKVVGEALMSGCSVFIYKAFREECADWPMIPEDHLLQEGSEASQIRKRLVFENETGASLAPPANEIINYCGLEHNVRRLSSELSRILGFSVNISPDDHLRFRLPAHTALDMPWFSASKGRATSDLSKIREWAQFKRHLI